MTARIYPWLVLSFWLATMSWLMVTKVLPPLLGGDPPDYSVAVAPAEEHPAPVCWRITWNDRRIGSVASQLQRRAGGGTAVRHVVHFERLPVDAMLSESFGVLAAAIRPLWGPNEKLEVSMRIATELRFTPQRQFSGFRSVVDLAHMSGFLRLSGHVADDQTLVLTTRWSPGTGGKSEQQIRHEIDLPRRALVSDAFAPRSELRNLRVGQKWTIPIYRPFPPNSPVQIVEAVAARIEVVLWDGGDVETVVVEYREDAGSGLQVAREPVLREWVRSDGTVLQQELRISGLKLMFERMATTWNIPEVKMLEDEKHAAIWKFDSDDHHD